MGKTIRLWIIPLIALLATPSVRAELHFVQPIIDAGEVRRGPSLVRRFEFTNTGTQTIQITEAKASCGCMIPRLSSKSIEPGQSGWLELTVNTLTQPAGPNTWSVRVQYQEGDKSGEALAQLQTQLIAEVTLEPATLVFTTARSISDLIHIRDDRAAPFRVTRIDASNSHLTVSIEGTNQKETSIRVEVAADFPEGRHEETVSIFTSDPLYPELRIPVTVNKRAKQRLCATPDTVVFLDVGNQELPVRIVLLRDEEEKEIAVERVWADDPAILTKWAPGPGALATLKVQVDRKLLGNKELHGTVYVEFREPVRETVRIPVVCHNEQAERK